MLATPAWSHTDLIEQINNLTAELQHQPTDVELLMQRGDLYRRHEDYETAARDFATARKLRPDFPLLDFYQGRLFLETGDATAAERLLKQYLDVHPEHAAAWVLLGDAKMVLDQPEVAAENYAQAIIRSQKPSPSLYRLQILALVAAGEQHWSGARKIVDEGLSRFPIEVSLLGLGTDIALAENAPATAIAYIELLPQPILKLPQWKSRLGLQECLIDPPKNVENSASACLLTARKALNQHLDQDNS